jgi:hypothetical protein
MPPVEFEPPIPASSRLQTYALELAATGIGSNLFLSRKNTVEGGVISLPCPPTYAYDYSD